MCDGAHRATTLGHHVNLSVSSLQLRCSSPVAACSYRLAQAR